METQSIIMIVIAAAMFVTLLVMRLVARRTELRAAAKLRKEHEDKTRTMTRKMSESGRYRALEQDDSGGKQDANEPVDQSIEAQLGHLNESVG